MKKNEIFVFGSNLAGAHGGGTTHFEITQGIIQHHAEIEEHQFDGISEGDRKQVWGMFAYNGQQVNGESLFLQYYNQVSIGL